VANQAAATLTKLSELRKLAADLEAQGESSAPAGDNLPRKVQVRAAMSAHQMDAIHA